MIKTYAFLFILLALFACNPDDGGKDDSPSEPPTTSQPSPTPAPTDPPANPPTGPGGEPPIIEPAPQEPAPTPAPVPPSAEVPPDRADTFKFNIVFGGTSSYNTKTRRDKYMKAVAVCDKVIASKEFKDRVLAFDYIPMSGEKCKGDGNCIYEHILDGNEVRKTTKDNEADLEVRFYYSNNSTIGYTYPSVDYIMVNTKFFDDFSSPSICANLVHEWLHKMGYGHDSARTARRPSSVPYAIGGISENIAKKVK